MEQIYEMKVALALLYLTTGFCWGVYAMRQQEKYYPESPVWKNNMVYWVNALLWPIGVPMAIRFNKRKNRE